MLREIPNRLFQLSAVLLLIKLISNSRLKDYPALHQSNSMNFSENSAYDHSTLDSGGDER
jgi:hypothetical protein